MYALYDFDSIHHRPVNAQFRAQGRAPDRRQPHSGGRSFQNPWPDWKRPLSAKLHAYMLRWAIPLWHGLNPGPRCTSCADIADRLGTRAMGHFHHRRKTMQYNWPELRDVPDMLDALRKWNMHLPSRTSGNTIAM